MFRYQFHRFAHISNVIYTVLLVTAKYWPYLLFPLIEHWHVKYNHIMGYKVTIKKAWTSNFAECAASRKWYKTAPINWHCCTLQIPGSSFLWSGTHQQSIDFIVKMINQMESKKLQLLLSWNLVFKCHI